jgi:phospholipid/cholesterol/gamma-HCH transport system substrate-binding protein
VTDDQVTRGRVAGRRSTRRPGSALATAAAAGGAAVRSGLGRLRGLSGLVKVVSVVTVLALVAALVWLWPGADRTRVTAYFTRTVGLYEGSEVRILGIPVGLVTEVVPEGEVVRVELEYDAAYDVPADAQAVVISPSVVSDRYVQLLPVHTGGPALADGAEIPVERTAVPVELDRVFGSLDDLAVALGPEGANEDGALSRVLETGAANLDGNGEALGTTIEDLGLALDALASNDDDLFATVENLQTFTTTLAENDQAVTDLNTNLATVSDQLAGERDDLALALQNLAVALAEVESFVRENREVLTEDVAQLESVTASVASQQEALAETLVAAPTALSNLGNAYNPRSGTLDTRDNVTPIEQNPLAFLCSLLNGSLASGGQENAGYCEGVLDELSMLLDLLPGGLAGPLGGSGSALPGASSGLSVPAATAPAGPDRTLAGILPGGGS